MCPKFGENESCCYNESRLNWCRNLHDFLRSAKYLCFVDPWTWIKVSILSISCSGHRSVFATRLAMEETRGYICSLWPACRTSSKMGSRPSAQYVVDIKMLFNDLFYMLKRVLFDPTPNSMLEQLSIKSRDVIKSILSSFVEQTPTILLQRHQRMIRSSCVLEIQIKEST